MDIIREAASCSIGDYEGGRRGCDTILWSGQEYQVIHQVSVKKGEERAGEGRVVK